MPATRIDRREQMAAQTRRDILQTARRLFGERGYVATSIGDIAEEAGVAVQTIYARVGSKHGLLTGLLELIDEESGVPEGAAAIFAATRPKDVLRAGISLTRAFQERCGDVIGALFAAAAAEPDLSDAVAEGSRRHRHGARVTVDRIAELGGLREHLPAVQAAALLSAATSHNAWHEIVQAHGLSWKQAEASLNDALGRALLELP
ncbi:MAG: TetR/AcrR family transcriptional regulator [Acidimicrobiales bacterium]